MQSRFEEQFTAYIDLLGFKAAVSNEEEDNISKIHGLLTRISKLRSRFAVASDGTESVKTIYITPMITAFSDNIVISYPLKKSCKAMGDTKSTLIAILRKVIHFTALVAEDALGIGLLVRGGATIGNLYHTPRVIFGKALNDAYDIESKVSQFPRVALSSEIITQLTNADIQALGLLSDEDGWYHIDYFKRLAKRSSISADRKPADREAWVEQVKRMVSDNLTGFENQIKELGSRNLATHEEQIASLKLAESLAKVKDKWAWFGKEFFSAVERSKSQHPKVSGYATDFGYSPRLK
jgi:hypothetical protein